MPKGNSEDVATSRENLSSNSSSNLSLNLTSNSSYSMTKLDSKDGQDKVAISKAFYQRPKHDRLYCKLCNSHQEGFRSEHEVRRHIDREHKALVKKWVCEEPKDGLNHPKPVIPLLKCKACAQQKKKYSAYYNAVADLRRAHFKPKAKGRTKGNKANDLEKRGGKGGRDWPLMSELKYWIKQVEEQVAEFPVTAAE
jgi:hypothetical protein